MDPSAQRPGAGPATTARARGLLFAVSAALVAWPFLVVTVPPLADLPQHAAQVRLFGEAWAQGSPYTVQWGTPYSLVYVVLAAARAVVGPWGGELAAAKAGAALVVLLWVGSLHLLAWRFERPPAAAVLASMLVFSHVLYWGFLPFMMGFPLFALWLLWLRRPPQGGWRDGLLTILLLALIYLAHALWFAAALGWLGIEALRGLRAGVPWRRQVPRLIGAGSVAVLALAWFARISDTSFSTPPLWLPVWRRLLPAAWQEAAFGGLTGALEAFALAALLSWIAAASWSGLRRRASAEGTDHHSGGAFPDRRLPGRLALAGALLLAAALVLPDKYLNTIEFHDRWMPPALALLLLAVPPLRLRRWLAGAAAVTLLAGFVGVTALTWQRAEADELAGLDAALEALPAQPTVLGLDFLRGSRHLDHEPYLQTFAWGQVVHGGELNFSFADFAPSLVVYDPPRDKPWTGGLEWFPQLVRPGDFGWFDYLLVRAPEPTHRQFEAAPYLERVTPEAPWRLYQVGDDAPRAVSPRP